MGTACKRSSILRRKDLPEWTTLHAWFSRPIKDSSSFRVKAALLPPCCNRACKRSSFSSGRCNSPASVSMTIPNTGKQVVGPSLLCAAIGIFRVLHSLSRILSESAHCVERGGPMMTKSSKKWKTSGMPFCCKCQLSASATALKIFAEDQRPNGSHRSMNILPSHLTANRGRSCGCTGISRYADLISTLVSRATGPSLAMAAAISLTDTYDREDSALSMTSLTLRPQGNERSVINLHLPVLWTLGITPNLLMCNGGRPSVEWNGPAIRPFTSSSLR